ncbi:eCIS core domain-containing protein [Microscilla marina]|nr:DUF4157 domain-containing protein [Microscilla marina]
MTMQQSGHKSANESDNGNPTQLKTQKTLGKPQSIKTSSPYQPIPSRTGQQPPIQSKQSKLGGPIPSKQGKLDPIKAKQRPIQRAEKGKPSSQGSSTETQLKHNVSQLMGVDVTNTQVHYNSDKPTQLKAEAFAQGNQVHLAPGKERHLGHELAHIGQQKQGRVKPTLQMKGGTSINDDPQLEQEADKIGDKALQMKLPQGSTLPLPQKSTPSGNNAPVQRVIMTKDGTKYDSNSAGQGNWSENVKKLMILPDLFLILNHDTLTQFTNGKEVDMLGPYKYLLGETHTDKETPFEYAQKIWRPGWNNSITFAAEGKSDHTEYSVKYDSKYDHISPIEDRVVKEARIFLWIPDMIKKHQKAMINNNQQLADYYKDLLEGAKEEINFFSNEFNFKNKPEYLDKLMKYMDNHLDNYLNNNSNGDKQSFSIDTHKQKQLSSLVWHVLQEDQPNMLSEYGNFATQNSEAQLNTLDRLREKHMVKYINQLQVPAFIGLGNRHMQELRAQYRHSPTMRAAGSIEEFKQKTKSTHILKHLDSTQNTSINSDEKYGDNIYSNKSMNELFFDNNNTNQPSPDSPIKSNNLSPKPQSNNHPNLKSNNRNSPKTNQSIKMNDNNLFELNNLQNNKPTKIDDNNLFEWDNLENNNNYSPKNKPLDKQKTKRIQDHSDFNFDSGPDFEDDQL